MLASLDLFEQLPAAGFAILHPVKVVSLRDLHHAGSLRFPLVAPKPAASALRPPLLTFGCETKSPIGSRR